MNESKARNQMFYFQDFRCFTAMVLIELKNIMLGNFAGKWFLILSIVSISSIKQVSCCSVNFELIEV